MSITTDYVPSPREELYWQEQLAGSVPMSCPHWCEGKHGRADDPFHGRITVDGGVEAHCRTLVDTDSFEVVLVEEEAHPRSGLVARRYFVLNGPDCTVDPERHATLDFLEQLAQDLLAVAIAASPALTEIEGGVSK